MGKFGYRCPECGKGTVRQQEFLNYKTKVENYPFVVSKAIIGVCDVCGCKNFDPQERQRWIELYKKELESRHVLLGAEEIRKIRKNLGLSMESFAHLIGCTRQSIYNWENIKRKITQSRMTDIIIKLIRESIYKRKINIIDFLIKEAEKVKVQIRLDLDIPTIITSKYYEPLPRSPEEYSINYERPEEHPDFSPKLKIIS